MAVSYQVALELYQLVQGKYPTQCTIITQALVLCSKRVCSCRSECWEVYGDKVCAQVFRQSSNLSLSLSLPVFSG